MTTTQLKKTPQLRRAVFITFGLSILGLLAVFPGLTVAQDSDALQRVQERAKFLNDFKALLGHSDTSVRAAAIQEALIGNDPELRSMALDTAMTGSDEKIQTMALRWMVTSRKNLAIKLEMPDRPSPAQEYVYSVFHGLVLSDLKLNAQSDELTAKGAYFKAGQLVRGGLEATFSNTRVFTCVLSAKVAGAALLAGSMTCNIDAGRIVGTERVPQRGTLPIRIDLS